MTVADFASGFSIKQVAQDSKRFVLSDRVVGSDNLVDEISLN